MKNKNTAGLLAFFLGGLGIHNFYLGKNIQGILYILFAWTWIPVFISIIEALMFWGMSQEKFEKQYGVVGQIECPYCKEKINKGSTKCRYCKGDLNLNT